MGGGKKTHNTSRLIFEGWIRMLRTLLVLAVLLGVWDCNSAGAAGFVTPPVDIMIDAGHGGIDGGSSHGDLLEKHINLQVAKELYRQLSKFGYRVILNRTGDYALSDENKWLRNPSRHLRDLAQRKHLAVELPPQILISLHMNWSAQATRRGSIVLYQKNNQSYMLASILQHSLNQFNNTSTAPVKGASYYLLKHDVCPTVIVEMGYISNARDRARLTSPEGQSQLARVVCEAVNEYLLLTGRLNAPKPAKDSWFKLWKRWWRKG